MSAPVSRVLVAGYGVMGRGVAASFAGAGFEVTVLTRDPSRLRDLPAGMRAVADLSETPPDLVIENWPEDLALKQELFRRMEEAWGAGPILATNTSGLDIEEIARPLAHPERFLAIHYMQPADAFPCCEVARLPQTDDATVERALAALRRTGKQPVLLARPVVGFLFNRLQHALLHEAYWMMEQGLVTAADVDAFARLAFGPRMCVTGLIEQKDLGGLEVHAASQRGIVPHLHHGDRPIDFVQQMPARGETGAASGKGFYDWTGRDVAEVRRRAADKTRRILEIVQEP